MSSLGVDRFSNCANWKIDVVDNQATKARPFELIDAAKSTKLTSIGTSVRRTPARIDSVCIGYDASPCWATPWSMLDHWAFIRQSILNPRKRWLAFIEFCCRRHRDDVKWRLSMGVLSRDRCILVKSINIVHHRFRSLDESSIDTWPITTGLRLMVDRADSDFDFVALSDVASMATDQFLANTRPRR